MAGEEESASSGPVNHEDLLVDSYDFVLPGELIAQHPDAMRDGSRLLHLDRSRPDLGHHRFRDLPDLLRAGDLLVLNNTRVIAARLRGRRATGGHVEALLLARTGAAKGAPGLVAEQWTALLSPSARLKLGESLAFPAGVTMVLEAWAPDGWRVRVEAPRPVLELLEEIGETPLPPYIKRAPDARRDPVDRERYQTVFARVPGSAAAPTAGLHFTEDLVGALHQTGVVTAFLTLHVGLGTFSPVRVARVTDHVMHSEWFHIPAPTLEAVAKAREEGRRVIAVGTTSVRALETVAAWQATGRRVDEEKGWTGETSLFIYPGHRFRTVGAMITNFHVPRSSLLMLVSAFAGRKRLLRTYADAVKNRYRFYSFGDAMLIT